MSKVNIIVNGVKVGEQSIQGEMHAHQNNPPHPATTQSRVLINGVLINGVPEEEVKATIQTPVDEFPPLPASVAAKMNPQESQSWEQPGNEYGDTFSIAENYTQWMNLKENKSLDKMFLASTPGSINHLITLHKYIGEVLDLDKVQAQTNHADTDESENDEEESVFGKPIKETPVVKKAATKKAPVKKSVGYGKYKKQD